MRVTSGRVRSVVIAAAIVASTAALSFTGLDEPVMSGDELMVAVTAHSIATTGRDLQGNFLPIFYRMPAPGRENAWYQPVHAYASAVALGVFPVSEWAIRLPLALVGIIDVLLIYAIARRLFEREWVAVTGALLLALSPSHITLSRVSLDMLLLVPFELAWLLCVVIYIDGGWPAWIFAAGALLSLGLFSYLSAYLLVPILALLTFGLLYHLRARTSHYAAFAAAVIVPALAFVPLLLNTTWLSDTFAHYEGGEAPAAGMPLVKRIMSVFSVYASFWDPRGLFVATPVVMFRYSMFVLPVAGLWAAGLLRAIARPSPAILLIVAGLLAAVVPAGVVPEPRAFHRVASMLPFGVLLAAAGLDYLWTADRRAGRIAFAAVWATIAALTLIYRAELPRGQAFVRASTVPLVVMGLAALLQRLPAERRTLGRIAAFAVAGLIAFRLALFIVSDAIVLELSIALLTVLCISAVGGDPLARFARQPLAVAALLAAVTGLFMYAYVDFADIPPLPLVRPSLAVPAVRLAAGLAALGAVLLVVAGCARVARLRPLRVAAATPVFAAILIAYVNVDRFAGLPARTIQAAAILAGAVGVALVSRTAVSGPARPGAIATVAVVLVSVIQFRETYLLDLVHRREPAQIEQRVARDAFEAAVIRASARPIDHIYVGGLGPFARHSWAFYALKHQRPDLVSRANADPMVTPEDVDTLPPASLAIVARSDAIDAAVGRLAADGRMQADTLAAPDGTPLLWLLERQAR